MTNKRRPKIDEKLRCRAVRKFQEGKNVWYNFHQKWMGDNTRILIMEKHSVIGQLIGDLRHLKYKSMLIRRKKDDIRLLWSFYQENYETRGHEEESLEVKHMVIKSYIDSIRELQK